MWRYNHYFSSLLIFHLNLSNAPIRPMLRPLCPFRCTCTSCFAAWPTSIPRVCATETSSPKTCWWTLKLPSSSCATLAGKLHVFTHRRNGGGGICFLSSLANRSLFAPILLPFSSLIDCPVPSSWSAESPTCRISARGIIVPPSSFSAPQITRQTLTSGQRAAFWLSCCSDSQYSQETVAWISWSRLSRWESPSPSAGAANTILWYEVTILFVLIH